MCHWLQWRNTGIVTVQSCYVEESTAEDTGRLVSTHSGSQYTASGKVAATVIKDLTPRTCRWPQTTQFIMTRQLSFVMTCESQCCQEAISQHKQEWTKPWMSAASTIEQSHLLEWQRHTEAGDLKVHITVAEVLVLQCPMAGGGLRHWMASSTSGITLHRIGMWCQTWQPIWNVVLDTAMTVARDCFWKVTWWLCGDGTAHG